MPQRVLTRYIRDRDAWIKNLVFPWAAGNEAVSMIAQVVDENQYGPPGAKEIVAITAPFTAGKSTLVRGWANGYYRELIGAAIQSAAQPTWRPRPGVEAVHAPVVWIDLGSASKQRTLTMQILDYFGYPISGRIPDLIVRFSHVVANHQVRLIIVDDIHLLKVDQRDSRQVLDHLKHINTVLGQQGGSLVFVGKKDNKDGLVFNDPQLAGRLQLNELHTFAADTPSQVAEWQTFLHGAEHMLLPYLPAASPGLLASTHAPRIWRRTQGFIGDTAKLLKRATIQAALDGSWTITAGHLDAQRLSFRATTREQALRGRRAPAPVEHNVEVSA
ncbi:TniB family NTP-binding protein [Promicromonospora soli]|nr:TniB family NTP-binding protein [Promicromonospora soli]